jgi:hypothetical protein
MVFDLMGRCLARPFARRSRAPLVEGRCPEPALRLDSNAMHDAIADRLTLQCFRYCLEEWATIGGRERPGHAVQKIELLVGERQRSR